MSEQSPVPGDLLITRRAVDGLYEISIVPGRPQLTLSLQGEAVQQAQAFAERNGGSVWLVEGAGYTQLRPSKRKEN